MSNNLFYETAPENMYCGENICGPILTSTYDDACNASSLTSCPVGYSTVGYKAPPDNSYCYNIADDFYYGNARLRQCVKDPNNSHWHPLQNQIDAAVKPTPSAILDTVAQCCRGGYTSGQIAERNNCGGYWNGTKTADDDCNIMMTEYCNVQDANGNYKNALNPTGIAHLEKMFHYDGITNENNIPDKSSHDNAVVILKNVCGAVGENYGFLKKPVDNSVTGEWIPNPKYTDVCACRYPARYYQHVFQLYKKNNPNILFPPDLYNTPIPECMYNDCDTNNIFRSKTASACDNITIQNCSIIQDLTGATVTGSARAACDFSGRTDLNPESTDTPAIKPDVAAVDDPNFIEKLTTAQRAGIGFMLMLLAVVLISILMRGSNSQRTTNRATSNVAYMRRSNSQRTPTRATSNVALTP